MLKCEALIQNKKRVKRAMKTNNSNAKMSCLFWYSLRAFRFVSDGQGGGKSVPVNNPDGSPRFNDNYLSFLQVISTYWEPIGPENDPKYQLNIFCNGGSVSVDRSTGERTVKAGYTVVLPQFLGEKFMQQFYTWAENFGLGGGTAPQYRETTPRRERSEGPRHSRGVNEADFQDPNEVIGETPAASFE